MNKFFALFISLFAFLLCSAETNNPSTESSVHRSKLERTGGPLVKRGTYLGHVSVISTQDKVPLAELAPAAELFAKETEMNFVTIRRGADQPKELLKATESAAAVIVIDDPTHPALLFAPEENWAMVNVGVLVDDLPTERAKSRFLNQRARREVLKALSLVCGGGASEFPNNPMSATSAKELDFVQETLPMDKLNNALKHLAKLGLTKKEMTTYRQACKEGWAPAPTNDIQKAIWDKTHEIPTEPIKIEFKK